MTSHKTYNKDLWLVIPTTYLLIRWKKRLFSGPYNQNFLNSVVKHTDCPLFYSNWMVRNIDCGNMPMTRIPNISFLVHGSLRNCKSVFHRNFGFSLSCFIWVTQTCSLQEKASLLERVKSLEEEVKSKSKQVTFINMSTEEIKYRPSPLFKWYVCPVGNGRLFQCSSVTGIEFSPIFF